MSRRPKKTTITARDIYGDDSAENTAALRPNRTRQVCFTLNNYTDDEFSALKIAYPVYFDYICFGKEVSASGTPHLQGYGRFAGGKAIDWRTVHKWPGCARLALSPAAGNAIQNRVYCAKGAQTHDEYVQYHPRKTPTNDGWRYSDTDWNHGPNYGLNADFYEYGILPAPGKRTDIHQVVEAIERDPTYGEILGDVNHLAVYAKYHAGFDKIRNMIISKNVDHNTKPFIVWLYGPTGVGKTRSAQLFTTFFLKYDLKNDFWSSKKSKDGIRFDGYIRQRVALFDEFTAGQIPYKYLLELTQEYKQIVDVKYGSAIFQPEIIFIAASRSIKDTYHQRLEYSDGGIDQLLRRISIEYQVKDLESSLDTLCDAHLKHLQITQKKDNTLDFLEKKAKNYAMRVAQIHEPPQKILDEDISLNKAQLIKKPSLVRQQNYQNLDDYFKK